MSALPLRPGNAKALGCLPAVQPGKEIPAPGIIPVELKSRRAGMEGKPLPYSTEIGGK